MTAHARPAAGRTGRPAAPAGPCRAPSVACARARAARSMPQARARVGARGSRALSLVLLAVLLPQTSANDIDKKAIAQETACADGLNTLTVTLQVTACSPGTHARPPRAASAPRPSPSASLKRPACVSPRRRRWQTNCFATTKDSNQPATKSLCFKCQSCWRRGKRTRVRYRW